MNLGRKPKPGEVTTMSSLRLSVGYIVASAFFLVIASVGFGLWLALEVVAL